MVLTTSRKSHGKEPDMVFEHKSVLLDEVIENMNIDPAGIYVDGTLGGAGHSYEIVSRLTTGCLIGLDQDDAAIQAAKKRLAKYGDKVKIIRSNFSEIRTVLGSIQIDKVNGILLDLGVSSYQLDTPERGFSYSVDAPLDMRMDTRNNITARDIINNYDETRLYRIIRDYGEDRFAKNIAKHIVRARMDKPIETTFQLNEIIKAAIPSKVRAVGGHPSKRTFQAIRIELNHELDVLKNTLEDMINLLKPGGRLLIITFHSLEDRIVKESFRMNENPCTCPSNFPVCVCGKKPKGRIITKKPILPSVEELEINKRSKSAKLRVFERTYY
jgi:16S rRNA (cytosine1402-N4)-methyltransferase